MSFIGNIAAAQSAKSIGKYNQSLFYQQAALQRKKTEVNKKVYDNIERPRLVKNFERQLDGLFVASLRSGVEVRQGTTPYINLIEARNEQLTDLAIEDYNSTTAYYDGINQSLLLQSKGIGERFKGDMMARSELFKAGGTMFGNYSKTGSILSG